MTTENVLNINEGDETNRMLIMRDLMEILPREYFEIVSFSAKGSLFSQQKSVSKKSFRIKLTVEID